MGSRQLHHKPIHTGRGPGPPIGSANAKGGPGGPGVAPGVKQALQYGLYSVGLFEEEKEMWAHIQVGTLEDEIRYARVMLRRACRAQYAWERQKGIFNERLRESVAAALGADVAAEFFHLDTIERKDGKIAVGTGEFATTEDVTEYKVIRRKTDFSEEILKYTRMLRSLEETHLKLATEGSGEDYARRLAEDIRAFGDAAMATLPGQQMAAGEPQTP